MNRECRLCHLNRDPDQRIIFHNHMVLFLQNEKEQGVLFGSGVIIPIRHAEIEPDAFRTPLTAA